MLKNIQNSCLSQVAEQMTAASQTDSEHSTRTTPRNRCTECPDASKTIKNQLPVKKYIEVMVLKSFQLELVTEIGAFANNRS